MVAYSLAHLTILELSPPEVARIAAEAGFDAFGLRLHPVRPGETPPPVHGDTPMRREVLSIIADTGVKMLDVEAFRLHRDIDFDKIEQAFEAAARFGATNALVFIDEADLDLARALYVRFCDLAATYSLDANLEFMPWLGVSNLDTALQVIASSERTNARLLLDALHFFRAGTKLSDFSKIDPRLINYAQVCDAPAVRPATLDDIADEARHKREFPGEGGLPVVDFVASLPDGIFIAPEVAAYGSAAAMSGIERARHALKTSRRVVELARHGRRPDKV